MMRILFNNIGRPLDFIIRLLTPNDNANDAFMNIPNFQNNPTGYTHPQNFPQLVYQNPQRNQDELPQIEYPPGPVTRSKRGRPRRQDVSTLPDPSLD